MDFSSVKIEDSLIMENERGQVEVLVPKHSRMTKIEYLRCFKKQRFTSNDHSSGSKMVSEFSDIIKCRDDLKLDITCAKEKIKLQSMSPSPIVPKAESRNYYKTEFENSNMARERVMKILRIVRMIYENFSMERKSEQTYVRTRRNRPDLRAAEVVENKFGKGSPTIGSIPGVEIGDKFKFRVELALVGLHMPLQCGIGTISIKNSNEYRICTSIVATDSYYENDMKDSDYLEYSGHGGIVGRSRKEPEDQKLERGNLALMHSKSQKNQVRVIRKRKENGESIFVYDGLYVVENCRQVKGSCKKLVFKFGLRRIPGQPKIPRA